jgi:hypothetical protein
MLGSVSSEEEREGEKAITAKVCLSSSLCISVNYDNISLQAADDDVIREVRFSVP